MAFVETTAYETQRAIAVRLGATLVFETLTVHPGSIRREPHAEVLLRVIDGLVRLDVEGGASLLGTGEEALIPAGAAHQMAAAAGEARVVTGLRPA